MNSMKKNVDLLGIYNIDFDYYINYSSKFDNILINQNKELDNEYINYKNNYICVITDCAQNVRNSIVSPSIMSIKSQISLA